MKNKNYRECRTKKQLEMMRKNGVKMVIWNLSTPTREYIERLGYVVVPYLYSIRTKKFYNIRNIYTPLLKEIHYSNKKGKKTITRELKQQEKEVLTENNIVYVPVKYKIYLQK